MKKRILTILITLLTSILSAQNPITVTGSISDATTGEPLIGVSIIILGTDRGTVTDFDGNFAIESTANATIRLSYVGYITKEFKATDSRPIEIKLEQDHMLIDELVVVGYSVQKKRDILGSISKVDNKELTKIAAPSTQQALQGRIAGVNISTQTGAPGSPISVRIRGIGSINASNEPLYIVDGIPQEGALSNISPNEIESITILKFA